MQTMIQTKGADGRQVFTMILSIELQSISVATALVLCLSVVQSIGDYPSLVYLFMGMVTYFLVSVPHTVPCVSCQSV